MPPLVEMPAPVRSWNESTLTEAGTPVFRTALASNNLESYRLGMALAD